MMKKCYFPLLLLFCIANTSFAKGGSEDLENVAQKIPQINNSLALIKKQTQIPVIFPRYLPKNHVTPTFYLYVEPIDNPFRYSIDIDASADCHGTHYCNLATIQAEKAAKPIIYNDRHKRIITTPIVLTKNIKGYFTPGHAMGSYFPANIQWQNNGVLFTISYDTSKENLLKMANSAIESALP